MNNNKLIWTCTILYTKSHTLLFCLSDKHTHRHSVDTFAWETDEASINTRLFFFVAQDVMGGLMYFWGTRKVPNYYAPRRAWSPFLCWYAMAQAHINRAEYLFPPYNPYWENKFLSLSLSLSHSLPHSAYISTNFLSLSYYPLFSVLAWHTTSIHTTHNTQHTCAHAVRKRERERERNVHNSVQNMTILLVIKPQSSY